jgi:hypothetical protein
VKVVKVTKILLLTASHSVRSVTPKSIRELIANQAFRDEDVLTAQYISRHI